MIHVRGGPLCLAHSRDPLAQTVWRLMFKKSLGTGPLWRRPQNRRNTPAGQDARFRTP